jgi:hypothetical protein
MRTLKQMIDDLTWYSEVIKTKAILRRMAIDFLADAPMDLKTYARRAGQWVEVQFGGANLSYTASPTGGVIVSDAGNDAIIPISDGINAGLLSPADKIKLNNTVNYTDENAQDAVGNALVDTTTIDFTYDDASAQITAIVKPNSITSGELSTTVNNSLALSSTSVQPATLLNYFNKTSDNSDSITEGATKKFVTTAEKATWNAKQDGLVSGANIKTINGSTILGAGNITVITDISGKEDTINKNVANGYAGLGTDGKLLSSQLPSITISDTFLTSSQSAMLALVAQTGDVSVRTDLNKSFILKGSDPTVLANWQELLTPTSAVTTVFGRNGGVTAQVGDYTADQITETATRVFQTPTQRANNDATSSIQTQLNSKANIASPTFTGIPAAPTAVPNTSTTQVATTAFVGDAITTANSASQALDVNNVKLTGNQTITGVKTFTNALSGFNIFSSNTSSGTGVFSNNSGSGSGIVSNQTPTGNGFNYVGQNNQSNTFTVDKLGAVTGTSFVNPVAPATNLLKADGTTIAQTGLPISTATQTALDGKANIASPTFTGVASAPTATVGTNTTQIATTAFVLANAGSSLPVSATQSGIVNNVSLQELGGVDKTINGVRIGTGGGNNSTNTVNGSGALVSNTTGSANTANGLNALQNNTTGGNNTASGVFALRFNTIGSGNTANGLSALQNNTTGDNNTASGQGALQSNTIGTNNTANGQNALFSNTSGTNNTANGLGALRNNTTGSQNTASGLFALRDNTTGSNNTASGTSALQANTTGFSNTANGVSALQNNTTGSNNVASGGNALRNNGTGNNNTASGVNALQGNTTGDNNTANGKDALANNTTGVSNTAIGQNALTTNTTGSGNVANGQNALFNNTIGNSNTVSGVYTLYNNTTGSNNTVSGQGALQNNTTGSNNTVSGQGALTGNSTGNYNVGSGVNALYNNTIGEANIAIGAGSAGGITTGSNNTYIGQGTSLGNTSNTICLATGTTNRIVVDSTGKANLLGMLNIFNAPTFSDNTTATTGGLIVGDVYKTALGVLMIRF